MEPPGEELTGGDRPPHGLDDPVAAQYREEVWDTAGDALYQQELSATCLRLWHLVETASYAVVTFTASGSGFIAWGIWKSNVGSLVWSGLAAVAGLASAFRVSQKAHDAIQAEERLLDEYRKPAAEAQDLLHDLGYGLTAPEAQRRVLALRKAVRDSPTRPRGGMLDNAWVRGRALRKRDSIMAGWQ